MHIPFKRFKHQPLLLAASLLVVGLIIGGVLLISRPKPHQKNIAVKNNPAASSQTNPTANGQSADKQTPPAQGFSASSDKSSGSAVTLIAPNGNFVSNHAPGINGAPTEEQSVCNTTPGASCYIKFTKDNDSRTLPTQVADSSGSVIWSSWDVRTADFSDGQWQITAVATLNGQTKTSTDPLPLRVKL